APHFSGESLSNEVLPFTFARTPEELASIVEVVEETNIRVHLQGEYKPEISYADDKNPEEIISVRSSKAYTQSLIAKLSDREQQIIFKRYFEGKTFEEISADFNGLSKSWVSRIHQGALDKLRTMLLQDNEISANQLAA